MKISRNFSRSEFACKCGCGFDTVDAELVDYLQAIRDNFDRPVRITSGARCEAHNLDIGGAASSQHLIGRAADFVVDHVPPGVVQEFCEGMDVPGLGRYEGFTHIDTRSQGRWRG